MPDKLARHHYIVGEISAPPPPLPFAIRRKPAFPAVTGGKGGGGGVISYRWLKHSLMITLPDA